MASQSFQSPPPAPPAHGPATTLGSNEMTRSEMLWTFRTTLEGGHRYHIRRGAAAQGYMYRPSVHAISALPGMTANDLADTCNKSVPLYIRIQHGDGCRRGLLTIVLHNYGPYRTDIEHHRFVCKFTTPRDLPKDDDSETSPPQSMVAALAALTQAIAAEADACHQTYTERIASGDEDVAGDLRFSGLTVRNLMFHGVQPLFRALFIIVDSKYFETEDDSSTVGRLPVFLVHTGIEDGLSAPISFSSIGDRIEGYKGEAQAVVKTSLETAIDFIMALEERERQAFGLQPPLADDWDSSDVYCGKQWRKQPWCHEPLMGPSSRFVDSVEFPHWSGDGEYYDSLSMTGKEKIERMRESSLRGAKNGVEWSVPVEVARSWWSHSGCC